MDVKENMQSTSPLQVNDQEMVIRKCKCDTVWCPSCYKQRKVPRLYERINGRFDWKSTRHIVLTIDRNLYSSGEKAYLDVTQNKRINQLVHNLKRTVGVKVRDYVWVLEFHRDGFPHWHIFVDTTTTGKEGQIHFSNILRYWQIGKVKETYFKTEKHWENLVGYFGKSGYFDKDKGHQAKLPDWGLRYTRTIKRSGSGKIQSHIKTDIDKKKIKERKEMREKAKVDKKNADNKYMASQGMYTPEPEETDNVAIPYGIKIEKCGSSSSIVVYINDTAVMGFNCPVSYNKLVIEHSTGEFIPKMGFVVKTDELGIKTFIRKYCPKLMGN